MTSLRSQLACALLLSGMFYSGHALACIDPCWQGSNCVSVERVETDLGCGDDYAFLDPENDSRTNLALLYSLLTGQAAEPASPTAELDQADQAEAEYQEAYSHFRPDEPAAFSGELDDTQCHGNGYAAATAYLKALAGAKIDDGNARRLAQMRNKMLCATVDFHRRPMDFEKFKQELLDVAGAGDAAAFAAYLGVAVNFYWARYDDALAQIEPLLKSHNDWIHQAGMILKARLYMIRAQGKWDGYDYKLIDPKDLGLSAETYAAYLRQFPQGLYAKSARGMLRRVRHLSGDDAGYQDAFLKDWRQAQQDKVPLRDFTALIQEADKYIPYLDLSVSEGRLKGGVRDDPLLFAAGVMVYFRSTSDGSDDSERLLRQEIEKHGPMLDGIPGLKSYLLMLDSAAHADWDQVLAGSTASMATEPEALSLAKRLLIATAQERKQNWGEALAAWASIASPANGAVSTHAQAGYVRTAMEAGRPLALFLPTAPFDTDEVPAYAIRHFFSVEALRAALEIKDLKPSLRTVATQTLLLRYALDQKWGLFLQEYDRVPAADRAELAPIETAARTLAKHPKDAKALLNAGYFFVDRFQLRDALTLCGVETSLDANLEPILPEVYRDEHYERPIGLFKRALDQHPGGDLEARILFHGIKCFSPAWSHACAESDDTPSETREQWFDTLKSRFPTTKWAQQTKYWW